MMNQAIEEKLLLIRKKAEQLEMLAKQQQEYMIRALAIDIKLLVHGVFVEKGVQEELDLKKKGKWHNG